MSYQDRKDGTEYSQPARLPAVDAMRGVVMVLMTVDHASHAFNAGRYVTDSMALFKPGSAIPPVQFLVRWVTHLCAPTFIFLAGLVLALSIARKQSKGVGARQIDADLLKRGLFIMALDPLWMSLGFGGGKVLQVLYAIGGAFCCMVLLRRMSVRALLVAGILIMVGGEALAGLSVWLGGGQRSGPVGALLATGGRLGTFAFVLYPLLPWLAYMILGMACGRLLERGAIKNPGRWFAVAGSLLLSLFVVIRGLNGYGNMLLYRDGLGLLQWLHVSKYPPSLTFGLLTLGLMGLVLALLFRIYSDQRVSAGNPLIVYGRTPLFFYVLHVHLLGAGALMLGLWEAGGLTEAFAAAVVVMLILYPLCRWYARFKKVHAKSILRFV